MYKLLLITALTIIACKKHDNIELPNTQKTPNQFEDLYPSNLTVNSLKELEQIEEALNFFVIGDWGRQGYFNQAELGAMMNQISMVIEPEFIISTGDNFYPSGVRSTQDPLWTNSFESIYKGSFLQVPWYIVLGNHDYKGNIDAQIKYSNISRRWNLPSRYWSKDIKLKDSPIAARFTFLDTNPLQDDYYTDVDYKDRVKNIDTISQLKWANKSFASTPENYWNLAVGHHPLYTGGKRKSKIAYSRKHLESYFDRYKVDAYFCGHEHDLQHIAPVNHYTQHFISGAGSKKRNTGKIEGSHSAHSDTGIMIISLTTKKLLVQIVNYKGEILYKNTILKK